MYLGEFGDQGIWKRVSLRVEGAEAGSDSVGVGCLSGKIGARTMSLMGWLCGLVVGGAWTVMVMCLDRV